MISDKRAVLLVVDLQEEFVKKVTKTNLKRIKDLARSSKVDVSMSGIWVNNPDSNYSRMLGYTKSVQGTTSILSDAAISLDCRTQYSSLTNQLKSTITKEDVILVCGAETDACVLATCFSLFDNGYSFKVISDLCFTKNEELQQAALTIMKRNFGKNNVATARELGLEAKSQQELSNNKVI